MCRRKFVRCLLNCNASVVIFADMQPLPPHDLDFRKALPSSETALVAAWCFLGRLAEADPAAPRRADLTFTDLLEQLTDPDRRGLDTGHEIAHVLLDHLNDARRDAAKFWKTIGSFETCVQVRYREDFDVLFDVDQVLLSKLDRMADRHFADGKHRTFAIQNYMSATKRDALVNALVTKLLSDFSTDDGIEAFQIKVVELAAFAIREVCEVIELRLIFYFPVPSRAAPSTREMVLSFVLWTGCPPPTSEAFAAHVAPIASFQVGAPTHDIPHFGPQGPPGPAAWPHRRTAQALRRGSGSACRFPHGLPPLVRRDPTLRGRDRQLRPWALAGACRGRMVADVLLDSAIWPGRTAAMA